MDRPLFSEILADRRRQLGYSIPQASRVLRLREDVLVAFEEGDFSRMPKSGYAQGMISSYARYLGLDATEMVEAYAEEYERYRREGVRLARRNASSKAAREARARGDMYVHNAETYVASKGLLPTSGGLAGDLGSFATTRVRARGMSGNTDADYTGSMEPVPAYPQSRPYTGRPPAHTTRSSHGYSTRAQGDIDTLRYDPSDYQDDLRLGREARPYESASSSRGRRDSRNIGNAQRPRVRRSSSSRNRRNESPSNRRGRRRQRSTLERLFGNTSQLAVFVVIGVILILSFILIFSVASCVRQDNEARRTVPVSAATTETTSDTDGSTATDKTGDGSSTSTDAADTTKSDASPSSKDTASTTTSSPSSKDTASTTTSSPSSSASDAKSSTSAGAQQATSVSVSVADGAVTWLEVECDGKSDVADTVTGPWQRTYTVEEALSVQASDTTAVTVVQNGKQMQFDSMASGIGTLRVQGTKTSKSSSKNKDKTSANGAASAKTGNASSDSGEQASKDGSSNNSQQDRQQGVADSSAGTGDGQGYDAYDESYGYGYDDGYDGYDDQSYDEDYGY